MRCFLYADDASGFSIGFDANALSIFGKHPADDPISSDIFSYDKIVYSEYDQKSQIRKCAKQLISELKPLAAESEDNIRQMSMVAFNRCFLKLFNYSIFMKNPFFKEEKEWRICYCANLGSDFRISNTIIDGVLSLSNVSYYSRKNDIVPYVDLSFKNSRDNIIKKIFIGSKCRASKKEIETYVRNYGVVCEVEKSSGTYR